MPVRPPTPDTIKAEVLWTQSGIPAANILHVGYDSGAPDAVDLASLATALSNAIKGAIQGQYGADTVCVGVTCTDIASDSGHVGSDVASWDGTGAGNNLSAGTAFLINWQQPRRYRGGKPRTYFPAPLAGEMVTQSEWSAGAITAFSAAATALLAAVNGATFGLLTTTSLGCVSYLLDKVARVVPLFEPFSGFTASAILRTQRRRITASSF